MSKRITNSSSDKPRKPYADFPLFPHDNGQWAKKIRGRLHYFGKWDNWQDALSLYQKQAADLHAGRKPREDVEGTTIEELVENFLAAKQHLVDTREIVQRTWDDYDTVCRKVMDTLGKERMVADLRRTTSTCFVVTSPSRATWCRWAMTWATRGSFSSTPTTPA